MSAKPIQLRYYNKKRGFAMNRSVSMRNLKEMLRLMNKGTYSYREIGRSCGCSERTVRRVRDKAKEVGIVWPLPEDMDENALDEKMYGDNTSRKTNKNLEPDAAQLVREMTKAKHVTMKLLHEEYKFQNPEGIGYTQFCQRIRSHQKNKRIWMPQLHKPGESVYVDWVGETMHYRNMSNKVEVKVYLFVGVLGGSNYPYIEAFDNMNTESWLTAHVHMFEYIKGTPVTVIPDNCRTAVREANMYEPSLNQSYQDLGNYYGVTIIPARVRRPQDKSMGENGVFIVEAWVIAALRNHKFFSLKDINTAIMSKLVDIVDKPFQIIDGTRRSLYETIDLPVLSPLPQTPFEIGFWKKFTVRPNYHIMIDKHFYSVPYKHVSEKVDAKISANFIEIYFSGLRIACHPIGRQGSKLYHTILEHMPKQHSEYAQWTPERFQKWASEIGSNTFELICEILKSKAYPQHAFNSCFGVLSLAKKYSSERIENASLRALSANATTYRSLKNILENNLDQNKYIPPVDMPPVIHENIRGAAYYAQNGGKRNV